MTCGACHPEAFRAEYGGRVLGYAVSARPGRLARQVQQLFYMGAEHVFMDEPVGQVRHRKGFKAIRKVLCKGDTLLLGNEQCLGTKPQTSGRNIDTLQEAGLVVRILKS